MDAITGTVTRTKERRSNHSPIRALSLLFGSSRYFNLLSSIEGFLGDPEGSSMNAYAPEQAAPPPPPEPMEVEEESPTNSPSDVRVVVVAPPQALLRVDSSWADLCCEGELVKVEILPDRPLSPVRHVTFEAPEASQAQPQVTEDINEMTKS